MKTIEMNTDIKYTRGYFMKGGMTVCLRLEVVGLLLLALSKDQRLERKANHVERRSSHLKRTKVLGTWKLCALLGEHGSDRETRA